jgi:hypothetical protein
LRLFGAECFGEYTHMRGDINYLGKTTVVRACGTLGREVHLMEELERK